MGAINRRVVDDLPLTLAESAPAGAVADCTDGGVGQPAGGCQHRLGAPILRRAHDAYVTAT